VPIADRNPYAFVRPSRRTWPQKAGVDIDLDVIEAAYHRIARARMSWWWRAPVE
jgi:hypothetical protein